MTVATVAMTGNQNIDGILSGIRWSNPVIDFSFPNNEAAEYGNYAWRYTYDHDNNAATENITITVDETNGFSSLNATQQSATRAAFTEFARLTATDATELDPAQGINDDHADIRLGMSSSRRPDNTTAHADYPANNARGGDIWFNPTDYNTPRLGTYAYQTFFHEIGHALGLKHGHQGDNGNNTVLSSDRDSLEFSTMTYRSFVGAGTGSYTNVDGHYPQTFMMLDISALQTMYGADFTHPGHATGTTYRFDPTTGQMFQNGVGQGVPQDNSGTNTNVIFRTIWDGGGTDTYDFSAYGADRQLSIDLAPGGWTDVDSDSTFQAADLDLNSGDAARWARGQVFNALQFNGDPRSLIENAVGGAGDDLIRGNQTHNTLDGRDGRDTLEGFDGQDTFISSNGGDHMDGGASLDHVNYSADPSGVEAEMLQGKIVDGWGNIDTVVSIENLTGSAFDDQFRMDSADNTIRAGAGADRVDAATGADSLYGDAGNDVLVGGHGRQVGDLFYAGDWIDGGADFDIAAFGSAVTINLATGVHTGEAREDTFVNIEQFNGSAEVDTMVANNARSARFAGGDGEDALYGGDQFDWLQGGKGRDYINGGGGFDMVSYADAPNAITAELYFSDGTTDGKITAGEWGLDTLVSIEDVEGTAFGDVLLGDERDNKLVGLGGDDRIEGDQSNGPQGSLDQMYGGAGNDRILIGANDVADGGIGIDEASFVGGPIDLNFSTGVFRVGGQAITVSGFETYIGTAGVDSVRGAAHGETISLGAGNDFLYGQGGDDFLYTDVGADVMDGGAGRDTMVFHKAMVADWQSGVLDADIGSDSWASWEVIQGSGGDDRIRTNSWGYAVELRGGAGNDVLATGVAGVVSDILAGEAGNDQLDGGAGVDTAVFSGARGTYDVRTFLSGGVLNTRVAHTGTDGVDTLSAMEKLKFSGGAIDLVRAQANRVSSVDGDRFDDVLFQSAGNGQVLYARMVDGAFQSWGVDTGALGSGWKAVATGNVNPSATSGGAETFVQQASTGSILYASQDTGATTWGVVSNSLTSAWKLRAAGDVNGDASADVIVQNQANGAILYADMKGGAFQKWGVVNQNLTSDWLAVGSGDINRDGFTDVVVQQQSTGTTLYANMANGAFGGWGVVSNTLTPNWDAKGVADLTGDGFAEVIFQNTAGGAGVKSGTTFYADMKTGVAQWGVVTASVDGNWEVQGTADVDNDGSADVLFQHATTGAALYADMNAGVFAGWGVVAQNVTNDWQVV